MFRHFTCVYIYIYIHIPSNKVVSDQYIHFVLVHFEHNGDDEPYNESDK